MTSAATEAVATRRPGAATLPAWARLAAALSIWVPAAAVAQGLPADLRTSGYYLNVATGAAEGPLTPGGVTDFQRLRLMAAPQPGPLRLDLAWELSLELVSDPELGLTPNLGRSGGGTDRLPLQGTLHEWEHGRWRHRVDRLRAALSIGPSVDVTAGRQTVSWATTLIFTPADPFAPFDPADPFRTYRAGVDALRVQAFPGPFTELDGVVRVSELGEETEVTALGRAATALGPWQIAAWAGALYGDGAASVAATLTAAGTAFRLEAALRGPDGVARLAAGADRNFRLAGHDLYVGVEYQRDGFGATDPGGYAGVLASAAAARGELQVVGRNEAALQAALQLTPLVAPELLAVWNLDDGSVLLAPAADWSLSDETSLRGGAFLGLGPGRRSVTLPVPPDGLRIDLPASEYGPVPSSIYLAVTTFF